MDWDDTFPKREGFFLLTKRMMEGEVEPEQWSCPPLPSPAFAALASEPRDEPSASLPLVFVNQCASDYTRSAFSREDEKGFGEDFDLSKSSTAAF
ncbi:unnamed protein product [Boreogadus saida]